LGEPDIVGSFADLMPRMITCAVSGPQSRSGAHPRDGIHTRTQAR
jgi:hypothetical protein